MPPRHQLIKTYEEFLKIKQDDSETTSQALWRQVLVAQKTIERLRAKGKKRYYREKEAKIKEASISCQTEPEPVAPAPAPAPEPAPALPTIPEEPPKKEKRLSFTIPNKELAERFRSVSPAPRQQFPKIIQSTK